MQNARDALTPDALAMLQTIASAGSFAAAARANARAIAALSAASLVSFESRSANGLVSWISRFANVRFEALRLLHSSDAHVGAHLYAWKSTGLSSSCSSASRTPPVA